jgi:hypothetical protein
MEENLGVKMCATVCFTKLEHCEVIAVQVEDTPVRYLRQNSFKAC